jgi:hypothetical protein
MAVPKDRAKARFYPKHEEYDLFKKLAALERVSASQLTERLMAEYLEKNRDRLLKPDTEAKG